MLGRCDSLVLIVLSSKVLLLPYIRSLTIYQQFRPSTVRKGQSISKAIYGLLTSPKNRTDEFVSFAFLLFTPNKSNSFVRFLGESTARQSAFRFDLTFSSGCVRILNHSGHISYDILQRNL